MSPTLGFTNAANWTVPEKGTATAMVAGMPCDPRTLAPVIGRELAGQVLNPANMAAEVKHDLVEHVASPKFVTQAQEPGVKYTPYVPKDDLFMKPGQG